MYLALWKTGPATARAGIENSDLDRATGYRVLIRLKERGLVTTDGHWPQTFTTVGLPELWDRVIALVRDEAELHQGIRHALVQAPVHNGSSLPSSALGIGPRPAGGEAHSSPAARILTGSEVDVQHLIQTIREARQEIQAVLPARQLPTGMRQRLGRELSEAVARHVQVRLVVDHHAADLRFLKCIRPNGETPVPSFQTRFFVPAFLHLFIVDHRWAFRYLGLASPAYRGPYVGVVSDSPDFVRSQEMRFQFVWNGAGSFEIPPSPANGHPSTETWATNGMTVSWMREDGRSGLPDDSRPGYGARSGNATGGIPRRLNR